MKYLITLAFLCLFASYSCSQDFKGILGAKSDSVIEGRNYLMGDENLIHIQFVDAKQLKNGYMILVYQTQVKNDTSTSLDIFYFNKTNICVAYKTVQNMENLSPQLKTLNDLGYKQTNANTLILYPAHVKATYYTDLKSSKVIFVYSRPETPNIF